MSDIKLFRMTKGVASEVVSESLALEKSLQTLIERNLENLLGVRFLATEYATGKSHRGRVDTLGLDENGCPVIIEYKRAVNENVINQGLYYLDWLLDHKAEFKLLAMEKLGRPAAEKIDWSSPRLLCVAGDFTRYDEHAVQQINRNIELVRYRRFGGELLLLELVNAITASQEDGGGGKGAGTVYKTIAETLASLEGDLKDLYEALKAFLAAMGDDVQVKTLKYYVAFRRLRNFACVEVHPTKRCLTVFVNLDPKLVSAERGFTRDVTNKGHFGTGNVELTIRTLADLEKAKPLILRSYQES